MFRDRKDAAEQLARALDKYRDKKNVLVLGIPRGGVETAYYVARYLHANMSFIIMRKLGYPFNPEAAFGAVAEDGSIFLFQEAHGVVSEKEMDRVLKKEVAEIERRIQKWRGGKSLPSLKEKTILLVDDGIATGATLFAAISLCKKQGASEIVVAAPISAQEMKARLQEMVDEVVILYTPSDFYAVGQGYERFESLTDEETLAFITKANL